MQTYNIAFARLEQLIPFLHIAGTIFFIGIQAALWLGYKFVIKDRFDMENGYEVVLKITKKLGLVVFCSLILILVSGVLQWQDSSMKSFDPMARAIIATKYTLTAFLTLNLAYMSYKFLKASKAFKLNEEVELYENLIIIFAYFIPLNLIISLVTTYLGVAYRGF